MADHPITQPGLWEVTLCDGAVASAELWLWFHDPRVPRMMVSLDWIGGDCFQALFHVASPVSGMRLDTAPCRTDRDSPRLVFRRIGKGRLASEAARRLMANLSTPTLLLRKARYYLSGRANTAITLRSGKIRDDDAAYRHWREVHDAFLADQRFNAAGRVLAVYLGSVRNEQALADFLDQLERQDFANGIALMVVEFDDAALSSSLRRRVVSTPGVVSRAVSRETFTLGTLFSEAKRQDCSALIFLERGGLYHRHVFDQGLEYLETHPDCEAVYADSDHCTPAGERHDPVFKPGWSPEYLRAWNYVRAPCLFRVSERVAAAAASIAGSGAPVMAMLLELDLRHRGRPIHRLPQVLFHEWREASGDDLRDRHEREVFVNSCRARQLPVAVERLGVGLRRLHYRVDAPPLVSTIIPSRDNPEMLKRAVDSVLAADYDPVQIIIVDNGSTSSAQRALLGEYQSDRRVAIVEYDAPFNFAALINRGRQAATGEILLLLNDDIEATDATWLEEMVMLAMQPRIGCVGALLRYPDGKVQHAGVVLGVRGMVEHALLGAAVDSNEADRRLQARHEVSAVTAACLAVRAEVFDRVGGMDEKLAVTFNDIDFCLKVGRLALRNLMTPHACLIHHESASRGLDLSPEKHRRAQRELQAFLANWDASLADDPCYSPNMNRRRADYRLISSG